MWLIEVPWIPSNKGLFQILAAPHPPTLGKKSWSEKKSIFVFHAYKPETLWESRSFWFQTVAQSTSIYIHINHSQTPSGWRVVSQKTNQTPHQRVESDWFSGSFCQQKLYCSHNNAYYLEMDLLLKVWCAMKSTGGGCGVHEMAWEPSRGHHKSLLISWLTQREMNQMVLHYQTYINKRKGEQQKKRQQIISAIFTEI